tara:strand:+ start:950 stop:1123 length:174 start_codon:yes stop_codon:yes gene_type:complete
MQIPNNAFSVQPFRDKRTGEIVTQFSILDIEYFEEVPTTKKNTKKYRQGWKENKKNG